MRRLLQHLLLTTMLLSLVGCVIGPTPHPAQEDSAGVAAGPADPQAPPSEVGENDLTDSADPGGGEASMADAAVSEDEGDAADGSLDDDDCEPCNADVHPQAVDGCNAYNDDCDDEVDENCVYSVQGYAFGNGFVLSGGSADYKVKQSVGTTSFTGVSTSADYRVIPVWPVTGPPPEQAP